MMPLSALLARQAADASIWIIIREAVVYDDISG